MGSFKKEILHVIDGILDQILQYFEKYFGYLYNSFAGDRTPNDVLEKCKGIFMKMIKDFGKIQSLGKKGQSNEKRMWKIIEFLSDKFDFEIFF